MDSEKREEKLDVAETRMLRMMCGATGLDRIRSERISAMADVGETFKKVEVVRIRNEKRRRVCAQKSDGEGKEDGSGGRWPEGATPGCLGATGRQHRPT